MDASVLSTIAPRALPNHCHNKTTAANTYGSNLGHINWASKGAAQQSATTHRENTKVAHKAPK